MCLAGGALCCGCATVRIPEAEQRSESATLADNLCALSPQVDPAEAERAAGAAVRYPLRLAREWHATPPAVFNNVLVNAGIHPRGLCFQWADALTVKLMTLDMHTLDLHRGVADWGGRHEHSCVVVTGPGQDLARGIALDAWRHCGRLNWAPVARDKYAWREVELMPGYKDELHAAAGKLAAQAGGP